MPVDVVTRLDSQNSTYEPLSLQGAKTMDVTTSDRKKKMVSSSIIFATRYVMGRYSPSLRSLHGWQSLLNEAA